MTFSFQRSALSWAILGLMAPAWAQTSAQTSASTASPISLPELVITGNPLKRDQTSQPVSQMSNRDLRERDQGTLGETLNGLPGVSSTYFGPQSSRPVIRGLDGDRIRVLSNGLAASDASALSFDHAVTSDVLSLDRIEVLRGPAALLYGGSAVGGVVNLIDNRIPRERIEGVQGQVRLQAASGNQERSTAALLEAGQGDWAVHADAFDRRTGDVAVPIDLACSRTGAAPLARRICNSAGQSSGGAMGVSHFGESSRIGLSVASYHNDYGTVADDNVTIGMRSNRYVFDGEWARPLAGWRSVQLRVGHSDYQHTEFNAGQPETRFANQATDLRLEARHDKLGPWEGMVGVQAESGRFSAQGEEAFAPSSRHRSQAVFAHEEWLTGWGLWSVGARLEQVSVTSLGSTEVIRFETGERRFAPKSLATGLIYRLGGGWQWQGNAAYSERAPKDYELFANGPHVATAAYEVGNSSLGLEKSRSLDLGLNWTQGPNRLGLTAFSSQFDNFIGLMATGDTQDGLPVQRYEAVRASFQGLELSGNWRVWQGAGSLDLQGRADTVQARNLSSGEPLPRMAPMRLGANLLYARGPWSARLGFEHAAAQNRVPEGNVPTAAYTLWNLGLNYRQPLVRGQLNWFARIDNLTDQLAWSATSILTSTAPGKSPLPGRSAKVGVQWQF